MADGWAAPVRRVATLPGDTAIEGMAVSFNGDLLVLDGPGKRLLGIDAEAVFDLLNRATADIPRAG